MKHKIWPWFLMGFAVSLVALGALLKVYAMHPSGAVVQRITLWQYYVREWPRFFGPQTLGPATANQDSLIITTLQHVAVAIAVGLMVAGIAWWIQRSGRRSA